MDKMSKPKLSDVLGALVTSVAYGRNVADVGTLRIARDYYQNELLRGIPVPRLRIDRVSISLPLMLSDVILGTPAVLNKPEEIVKKISEAFMEEIKNESERLETLENLLKDCEEITADQQKAISAHKEFIDFWNKTWDFKGTTKKGISIFEEKLRENVIKYTSKLKLAEGNTEPSDISIIDTTVEAAEDTLVFVMSKAYSILREEAKKKQKERVAPGKVMLKSAGLSSINEKKEIEEAAQQIEEYDEDWARKELKEFIEGEYKKRLISEVRHAAENMAISSPARPPDLYVVVNTENIKNAGGGPEVVTRLNLVLHEEGLEWLSEKRDGKDTTILMPE
jgi:hypothetical protein